MNVRYSYGFNNLSSKTDPTGHIIALIFPLIELFVAVTGVIIVALASKQIREEADEKEIAEEGEIMEMAKPEDEVEEEGEIEGENEG